MRRVYCFSWCHHCCDFHISANTLYLTFLQSLVLWVLTPPLYIPLLFSHTHTHTHTTSNSLISSSHRLLCHFLEVKTVKRLKSTQLTIPPEVRTGWHQSNSDGIAAVGCSCPLEYSVCLGVRGAGCRVGGGGGSGQLSNSQCNAHGAKQRSRVWSITVGRQANTCQHSKTQTQVNCVHCVQLTALKMGTQTAGSLEGDRDSWEPWGQRRGQRQLGAMKGTETARSLEEGDRDSWEPWRRRQRQLGALKKGTETARSHEGDRDS